MSADSGQRLVLAGNPQAHHLGAHLRNAAPSVGVAVEFIDTRHAYEGPRWLRRASWWLGGRRPLALRGFGDEVVRACRTFSPTQMLATGLAPLDVRCLQELGRLGIERINY